MALADDNSKKRIGWIIAAMLSPVVLLFVFFASLGSGAAAQNTSAVELCFRGGTIPNQLPEEYRACIQQMRGRFALLDMYVDEIDRQIEEGQPGLDADRVKAAFFALYFGVDMPDAVTCQQFAECFATDDSPPAPVENMAIVWENLRRQLGIEPTPEQISNASSAYALVRYGWADAGLGEPIISAGGFCAPLDTNWRTIVTSEFGYRRDPFTGQMRGHTGMDLAVPTGTAVRAALPGKASLAQFDAGGYGYYVLLDHGDEMYTLYGHCSRLLVQPGQEVETGQVIALSGSTGRSTGPHLHFEVRVNGERVDPRGFLP